MIIIQASDIGLEEITCDECGEDTEYVLSTEAPINSTNAPVYLCNYCLKKAKALMDEYEKEQRDNNVS